MEKIRHQFLRNAVAHEIQRYIQESGLTPGTQLPAERDLMTQLGVGRSSLREGLRVLEGLGIIEVRRNRGSFIVEPKPQTDTVSLGDLVREQRDLLDLIDVRQSLEELSVQLAVQNATTDDLAAIERHLNDIEDLARQGEDNSLADWAFHRSVYAASHNRVLIHTIESISHLFFQLWNRPFGRTMFRDTWDLHRPIYEAIRDQDTLRAKRAVRKLLQVVRDEIELI